MLLAADIGNSTIVFGVFSKEIPTEPLCTFSVATITSRTSDEYELLIRQLLASKNLNNLIDCSVLSSVVPTVTDSISRALSSITGKKTFIIGTGTKTRFKIKIDTPSELGADIVANTAAVLSMAKPPMVMADFGTATTLTSVNGNYELIGTVIMPGIKISLDALSESAELLYNVNLKSSETIIGKNSTESIISGIINGNAYAIDGFINEISQKICKNGEKLSLFATGGLSHLITPKCKNEFCIIDNLTLIGAALLFFNNTK